MTKLEKIVKWGIPALVVGAIVYEVVGFYKDIKDIVYMDGLREKGL